jgi:DNA ligase-1
MALWNGCQLAKRYEPSLLAKGEWIAEPKLDGTRCVVIVDRDGEIHPLGRRGLEYQKLNPIFKDISWCKGFVFDGELLHEEGWGQTSGYLHRSSLSAEQLKKLRFNVFDVLRLVDYESGGSKIPLKERRKVLETISESFDKDTQITPTKQFPVTRATADKLFEKFLGEKYEGAMFKQVEAPYVCGRSESWLKVKNEVTEEATITGFQIGEGKHEGRLGALKVRFPDGRETKVGTGFSDAQREDFWARRNEVLGQVVEVRLQDDPERVAVARFPVFKRLRTDRASAED